jgi:hypothetical protein
VIPVKPRIVDPDRSRIEQMVGMIACPGIAAGLCEFVVCGPVMSVVEHDQTH